jgi:hypothetical protein
VLDGNTRERFARDTARDPLMRVAPHRRASHVEPQPKAGGTRSRVTGAVLDALLETLGHPTAGELTAAYNRSRRGAARVHVSRVTRALHRHDYVVKQNGAGREKWSGPTSKRGAPTS